MSKTVHIFESGNFLARLPSLACRYLSHLHPSFFESTSSLRTCPWLGTSLGKSLDLSNR